MTVSQQVAAEVRTAIVQINAYAAAPDEIMDISGVVSCGRTMHMPCHVRKGITPFSV